jgi:hypothetical protein
MESAKNTARIEELNGYNILNRESDYVTHVSSIFGMIILYYSGLRSLGVTFPPHDSSDVGSNPAEVVEFLRTEKFR